MTDVGESALVVFGTITLDTLEMGDVMQRDIPGGSAPYAALAARFLLPVQLVGVVGEDYPNRLLQEYEQRGIGCAGVEHREGATFRWHARYGLNGEERVTVSRDPGVAAGGPPDLARVPGRRAALLLASTHPDHQAAVRAQCAEAGLVALDSMRHWWSSHRNTLHALLRTVGVLFVDQTELALATGEADEGHAVQQLLQCGPEVVILKRGSRGVSLIRRDTAPVHQVAAPARVVDTTGAGDALAGAYVSARLAHPDWRDEQALGWAVAVAAIAVEATGLTGLLEADRAAVERFHERSRVGQRP